MFVCKICEFSCSRGSGHIKAKHDISTIRYLKENEQVDVVTLYLEGFSAQQIVDKIKDKNLGISPTKKDILNYLRNNNIDIRNTSEATKCWIDKVGGIWNKGLTKNEHPSIMKYAESRTGNNNPYFSMTEEDREKIRWWKYKSDFETKRIRQKIADNLRKQYKEGKLLPYSIQNPEWEQKALVKRLEGFRQYLINGNKHKFGNPSQAEKEISNILEEYNIRYVKQATVADKYSCDLLLPDHNLVIEYYGTYWHCDPRKYEQDYYNEKKNKTAKEIWDYDKIRENHITNNGYKLVIIWENDYKQLNYSQKKETIYEAIKGKSGKETSQR